MPGATTAAGSPGSEEEPMELTSDAFEPSGAIPSRFTCDGEDLSPALSWRGAPEGTLSYALVMDDPDAGGFVHWVIFQLGATGLPEGVETAERPPTGGWQGRNDFGRVGYGGPCPPLGKHTYRFQLYALDFLTEGVAPGSSKKQVEDAMEGHVLGTTTLTGTYESSR